MPDAEMDVLIVGAGPVGLTMAAAATRFGLTCRIIDKAPAASEKSKALVVWSRTMELLDQLDLTKKFIETGLKATGGSIYADGKRLVHFKLTGDDSPYGFPLMIPQNDTERLLTNSLTDQGLTIERSVELVTFTQSGDGVASTLRHSDGREEQVRSKWLAGCDGAHSTVRHTLGLDFTGHAEPNDWLLADLHIAGSLPTDEITVYWHTKGVLIFFPITHGRFRVITELGHATEGTHPPDPTLADVQAKVDERGPAGLTLSDPIWIANFRINERKVSDYRHGRVLLSGDAAHIHSPAGGQGMNTGMQDAFNLAWKLALIRSGAGQENPLLDSYSIERSAVGDQVLKDAEMFTTLATLHNPLAQAVRNHLAHILSSFQFVQDTIRHKWWELSINYRHSPLSVEDWHGHGGAKAGDRLPDAPLKLADGTATTLMAELRAGKHLLLLLPNSNDPQAISELSAIAAEVDRLFPNVAAARLILPANESSRIPIRIDETGRAHEQLAAHDRALIWVRPDGYIGYRAQPANQEKLLHYLRGYLLASN